MNDLSDKKQKAIKQNSVSALCDVYIDVVVPKEAHTVQILETRRAFMAGASSMFDLMSEVSDRFDEDTALQIINGFCEEFANFAREQSEK